MTSTGNKKINKLKNGFFPGLILPLVVFVVAYLASGNKASFFDFISGMWYLGMFFKMLVLCVLPNLILFLYFYQKKFDMAARGVLMATFIYAFVMIISKAL